jgi:hypothetical protein
MEDSSAKDQKDQEPDFRTPRAWWSGSRPEMGVAFWWEQTKRYHAVSYTEFLDADYEAETVKVYFTRFTITLTGKNLFPLVEKFRRQVVAYVRERHVSGLNAAHEDHWISEMKMGPPEPSVEEKSPKERGKAGSRKLFEPA